MQFSVRIVARRSTCWRMGLVAAFLFLTGMTSAQGIQPTPELAVPPSPMPEGAASPAPPTLPASQRWQDRPLGSLKATLRPTEGELPSNVASPRMVEAGIHHHAFGDSRPWMLTSYEWEAPATKHLPLLFEEPNVERLGYTYGFYWNKWGYESGPHLAECLQPVVSGVRFYGRIPFIPYMWGVDCPCEPIYTLGEDRPGSPICYRKHLVPLSPKGALYQTGAMVGLPYLIP